MAYAALRHWLPGEPPKPRASHGVFWGALSGFTTTLIQIGAPPYYAFVLPQRLPKMIYVGTTVMFFAAANVMKIAPYMALGQFSTAGLATSLALFPLAVATNCSVRLGRQAADLVGVPFKVVVTAESAGFYKPRPEPYRAVLEALGTAPDLTLFVAGSASDVPGAKGVGMAVYWHNRVGLPPRDDGRPDHLEASLDRLADLFR